MRRLPTLCVLVLSSTLTAAPPTTSPIPCTITIDPRVELLCTLMRLAGNREYNICRLTPYDRDLRARFEPFRDHDAVKLARDYAAGYDAPMSLAVHLTPLPQLAERIPFTPCPPGLDARLQPGPTRRLLAAARRFAADTRFDEFLASHQDLYATATQRMSDTLAAHADLAWFAPYFGTTDKTRPAHFHLILGLQNGPCNYGARLAAPDGDHLYSILGAWAEDTHGLPRFDKSVLPTVIHEFGHSYVNPIVDQHLPALRAAGQKIYARNAPIMQSQAYGQWDTMLREAVLRACVARYRLAHDGPLAYTAELSEQSLRGFTWTPALSHLLVEYESHRTQYPTFNSFMPRIVDFFNTYAAKLDGAAP